MRQLEAIDVLDGGGNISLAHTACVHGQYLALDGGDILLVLLDDLWLEGALTVTGNLDWQLTQGCPNVLLGIAVAVVGAFGGTLVLLIAQMILKLALQYGLEDGRENLFQDILHVLGILDVIAG